MPETAALADDDAPLVARAAQGDEAAVRALTTRHNRRLYRIARSILRDDAEAEDVVQETYVRAFTGLRRFRGASSFSTYHPNMTATLVIAEAPKTAKKPPPHD